MSDQSSFNTDTPKTKKFRNFTSSGGFKIAVLIILVLILLIPVSMVRSLISERSYRSNTAEKEIMEAWGSQFKLYGPIVRIPVVERTEVRTKTEKEGEKIEIITTNYTLWVTPNNVDINADFSAQKKRRGIFSVALFSGNLSLSGDFNLERAKAELKQNQTMNLEQAEIIIGLASQKGIRRVIKADWNGSELSFKPGNRSFTLGFSGNNGVNALSPFKANGSNTFDIQFAVQGGKSLRALPIGETTRVRVKTDWPSPSFQGGFLPVSYTLSENGFDAEWEISYLSRSIPLYWISNAGVNNEGSMDWANEYFGVDFFKPLDHYALNTRAVKYAVLFLIIPFLTLFFLEVFSQKAIHPIQYLLSGLANVIFYLLLLSISEHISFSLSYLIAAAALTCMMTLYARSLLETWTRSAYMGLVMALLYLIMYLTLNAEDWALLIGSIAAFVITGVVMFLTRRLDWSSLNIRRDK
jgi:inner membrane protein